MRTTIGLLGTVVLLLAGSFATEAQSAGTTACPRRPGTGVRQAPARPQPHRPLVGQRAVLPVDRLRAAQGGLRGGSGCGAVPIRTGSCGTAPANPTCPGSGRVLPPNTISESNLASANAALRAQGYTLRKGPGGEVILDRSSPGGR